MADQRWETPPDDDDDANLFNPWKALAEKKKALKQTKGKF